MTEINRTIYQLQESGVRLCEALRKIADGCHNPQLVAEKALNFKAPEPKWGKVESEYDRLCREGEQSLIDKNYFNADGSISEYGAQFYR